MSPFPLRTAGTRARRVLSDYDRMRARIPAVQVDASSSTWPRIYVAAPFEEASSVRAIHRVLAQMRYLPTSCWAELDELAPSTLEWREANLDIHEMNMHALLSSDLMIVKRVPGSGGEMFVEFERALQYGLPVFWAGRPILSSYRDGVTMFPDVPRLMAYLERAR